MSQNFVLPDSSTNLLLEIHGEVIVSCDCVSMKLVIFFRVSGNIFNGVFVSRESRGREGKRERGGGWCAILQGTSLAKWHTTIRALPFDSLDPNKSQVLYNAVISCCFLVTMSHKGGEGGFEPVTYYHKYLSLNR